MMVFIIKFPILLHIFVLYQVVWFLANCCLVRLVGKLTSFLLPGSFLGVAQGFKKDYIVISTNSYVV